MPETALVCPRCAAPKPSSVDAAIPKTVFEGDAQAALRALQGGPPSMASDDAGMAKTMLADPTPASPPATGGGLPAPGPRPPQSGLRGPGAPPGGGFAAQGTPPGGGFGGQGTPGGSGYGGPGAPPAGGGFAAQGTPPGGSGYGGPGAPPPGGGFAAQGTPAGGGFAAQGTPAGGGFAAQGTPAGGGFAAQGTPPGGSGFGGQGTPAGGGGFGGQAGQGGFGGQGTPPAQGSWPGAGGGAPGYGPPGGPGGSGFGGPGTPQPGGMAARPGVGPGGAPKKKSSGCRTAAIIGGIVAGVFLILLVVGGIVLCSALRGSGGGALGLGEAEEGTITSMTPETDGAPAVDYTFEVENAGWYQIELDGEASFYSFSPVLVVLRDGAEVGRAAAPQTVDRTVAMLSLPLQPGEHTVRVTTDGTPVEGRVTFHLTVTAAGAGAGPAGVPTGACARMAACCQALGPHPDFSGMCGSVPFYQSQPTGEATCQQQLPALQGSIRARGWQLPYDCQ